MIHDESHCYNMKYLVGDGQRVSDSDTATLFTNRPWTQNAHYVSQLPSRIYAFFHHAHPVLGDFTWKHLRPGTAR